jgi:hypothetical protein
MAKAKSKRRPARRNPVAAAVRAIKPKVVLSARRYKRRPKHKGRPEDNSGDNP